VAIPPVVRPVLLPLELPLSLDEALGLEALVEGEGDGDGVCFALYDEEVDVDLGSLGGAWSAAPKLAFGLWVVVWVWVELEDSSLQSWLPSEPG